MARRMPPKGPGGTPKPDRKVKDVPPAVRDLAQRLWDAFNADSWGDIDPWLFKAVADGGEAFDDPDAKALVKVLKKVIRDRR